MAADVGIVIASNAYCFPISPPPPTVMAASRNGDGGASDAPPSGAAWPIR
jgi:hypothetical protein